MRLFWFISAMLLVSSVASNAECVTRGGFFNLTNDSVSYTDTITNGESCIHPQTTSAYMTFEKVTVVSSPLNGKLAISGAAATYTPKAGYKGNDQYSIKVCGNSRSGSGCSTLTYSVTLQ
jgi:Bacterial Ig domain